LRGRPRTQMQIAFSPLDGIWFLIGASPDLRSQILATPQLAPTPDVPNPIAGLFLPSSDPENVAGLLQLCGLQSTFLFSTVSVQRILKTENRIFKFLDGQGAAVQWQPLAPRRRIGCHLSENPGDAPTFFYTAVPLGGDYPDYWSEESRRNCPPEEAHMGFLLEQADKKILFAPNLSGGNAEWFKIAESADVAVLDAGRWRDLLEQLPLGNGRKILTHFHHESPLLDEKGGQHRSVVEAGFEIAYDGMEIKL
jgi:pyrroloquinoline quinone biosynthesis protein B